MTIEPYFHRIFRKTDQSRRIPRKPKAELDCEKISKKQNFKSQRKPLLSTASKTKCNNGDDDYPEKKNTILNLELIIDNYWVHRKLQDLFRSPPLNYLISIENCKTGHNMETAKLNGIYVENDIKTTSETKCDSGDD